MLRSARQTNARVRCRIQEIDDEVDHNDGDSHRKNPELQNRVIAPKGSGDEKIPNAVPGEHSLNHHCA
jgi:hypothetical protein